MGLVALEILIKVIVKPFAVVPLMSWSTLRAHVSKYRPEVYKTGKSKNLKKIHKVALGKLLT